MINFCLGTLFTAAAGAILMATTALMLPDKKPSLKPAEPQGSKAKASPWTDPDYFVASEIGKAYHRPQCFYAAKQTKHRITFKTRQEAEESGRHACANCLSGTSQSSPQPIAQAQRGQPQPQ